jgi:calcineurin-like phosphoesterase family protein
MAVKDKWFISDTHFGHANMYKFVDDKGHRIRHEFKDYLEGDEAMIQRWNSVVKPQDYVYHLGDVTFQYSGYFNNIMSRLNGQKRLIIGNHDKLKNPNLLKWFDKAMIWHGFKEENFTATHFPHRLESLRDGVFNVHGHIHDGHMEDLHYINVSVEVRGYTPVHMDTILKEIKDYS